MRSELDEADDSDYRPRVALTSPTGRVNGFEDSLVDRIPRSQEPVLNGRDSEVGRGIPFDSRIRVLA